MKQKIKKLKQKNEDPQYLIDRDKITYCLTMISFIFTFGLLFYPKINITFNFILIIDFLLIINRLIKWWKWKWHYYLFDYCYSVNLFMLICIKFCYRNKLLLSIYFVNSFGPLAISFAIFKFKIVWHKL